MRFTGLGVGHLEYKVRTIRTLTVEGEPNWSELCPTNTTGEPGPAGVESEDDSDSGGSSGEDLDNNTF